MKMLDVTERRKKVRFACERTLAKLWKFAVAVAASFALRACVWASEQASERESDMRGGLLCCNEEEEDESRAERQTRLASRRRVELAQTRRVDDGAHKKTKGKAVGWRRFLKIK
jgi:hypothetical protein